MVSHHYRIIFIENLAFAWQFSLNSEHNKKTSCIDWWQKLSRDQNYHVINGTMSCYYGVMSYYNCAALCNISLGLMHLIQEHCPLSSWHDEVGAYPSCTSFCIMYYVILHINPHSHAIFFSCIMASKWDQALITEIFILFISYSVVNLV